MDDCDLTKQRKALENGEGRLKDLHGELCVNKKRASKGFGWVESVICIYIQGHCCLCLGCVQEIFQVTVCAAKHRKISSVTHFSTNAAAYCTIWSAKRADCTLFPHFSSFIKQDIKWKTQLCLIKTKKFPKKQSQHLKKTTKKNNNQKQLFPTFDVIGRFQALHCKTHTDCKQQHSLTRKQTQNPPIKPNFNAAGPYSCCFFPIYSFFCKISRQQCSLVNVRPVWSPRLVGPAFTFCWAKNKVHTESFAALIPRKWNFTPNPKQTRPHISLDYLNRPIECQPSGGIQRYTRLHKVD